jgi:hypothetical protein
MASLRSQVFGETEALKIEAFAWREAFESTGWRARPDLAVL